MARCIIIAPLYQGEERSLLQRHDGDLLICADGGLEAALRFGIEPDLVIGDFDSMPFSRVGQFPFIKLPTHKDDTDMLYCIKEGRRRGYHEFLMAGCLGGRLDHTLSNLQCLYDCALHGDTAWLLNAQNRVTVLLPGDYHPEIMKGRHLSLLAYTPEVKGINLTGAEWELQDAVLTNRFPIGCSNEVTGSQVHLSFTDGALILIWSVDAGKEKSYENCDR